MDSEITLDRATFKVLAADTRVSILKALNSRRMTGAELAENVKLSPSTVKEHLDQLESVGLIEQVDEGRKWKYYTLTYKGRQVISKDRPTPSRVWIVLALAILALSYSTYNIYDALMPVQNYGQLSTIAQAPRQMQNPAAATIAPAAQETAPTIAPAPLAIQNAHQPQATVLPGSGAETPNTFSTGTATETPQIKAASVSSDAGTNQLVPPNPPYEDEIPTSKQIGIAQWAIEASLVIIVAGLSLYAFRARKAKIPN